MQETKRLTDLHGRAHDALPVLCGHCGCVAYMDGPWRWDPGLPPQSGCNEPGCHCHVRPRRGETIDAH